MTTQERRDIEARMQCAARLLAAVRGYTPKYHPRTCGCLLCQPTADRQGLALVSVEVK